VLKFTYIAATALFCAGVFMGRTIGAFLRGFPDAAAMFGALFALSALVVIVSAIKNGIIVR
jgi:hypothetical protein